VYYLHFFRRTPNAHATTLGSLLGGVIKAFGANNAFVTKINPMARRLFSPLIWAEAVAMVATASPWMRRGISNVTGGAGSKDFPTATQSKPTLKGGPKCLCQKINPSGNGLRLFDLIWAVARNDGGGGITADSSGNAYVTGRRQSADFPTVKPLQSTLLGPANAFLTKINASGSAIVYSTFLGGAGACCRRRHVDHLGNAYIAGSTTSTNSPSSTPATDLRRGRLRRFWSPKSTRAVMRWSTPPFLAEAG